MPNTEQVSESGAKGGRKAKRKAEKQAMRQARKAKREERKEAKFKLRGFHIGTELRRSLPMIVRMAEEKKKEVASGTTRKTPQLRLRPVALCDAAEVDAVPESDRVSTQRFLDGFSQYRALILVLDAKILVRSGESRALIDRHPDCGHELVDAYLASRAMPLPSPTLVAPAATPQPKGSGGKLHEIIN